MKQPTQKITMGFLVRKENKNRHFQIINENGWLGKNNVYNGVGLFNSIQECSRLYIRKYDEEFRKNNADFVFQEQLNFQKKMLEDVMIGKNSDARKNSRGEVMVQTGITCEL